MMGGANRLSILTGGFSKVFLGKKQQSLPKSSAVLSHYLKQRGYPEWTAFYVPYCQAENDLYPKSHFNFQPAVDSSSGHQAVNYHVLRTGAFPFVKFHCTRRPVQHLGLEDRFYLGLKLLNLGLPTLVYGLAGLAWARHTEVVTVEGQTITLFFWYKETT